MPTNGNGTKRPLRDHPGEAFFQCETCGDYFHHNGIGIHRYYCKGRNAEQRATWTKRKHSLRLPTRNNTIDLVNVPARVTFFTDRERERLHITISATDEALLMLGQRAVGMGVVAPFDAEAKETTEED